MKHRVCGRYEKVNYTHNLSNFKHLKKNWVGRGNINPRGEAIASSLPLNL